MVSRYSGTFRVHCRIHVAHTYAEPPPPPGEQGASGGGDYAPPPPSYQPPSAAPGTNYYTPPPQPNYPPPPPQQEHGPPPVYSRFGHQVSSYYTPPQNRSLGMKRRVCSAIFCCILIGLIVGLAAGLSRRRFVRQWYVKEKSFSCLVLASCC